MHTVSKGSKGEIPFLAMHRSSGPPLRGGTRKDPYEMHRSSWVRDPKGPIGSHRLLATLNARRMRPSRP